MKLNLSKMAGAQDAFEAKRLNSSKTAPQTSFLFDEVLEMIRWALDSDKCKVCGGASWVGPHEMGCPIDVAQTKIGLQVLTQRCKECNKRVEIFNNLKPQKKSCPLCVFIGKSELHATKTVAHQRYEVLERKGKEKAARRQLLEYKRLSRLYKEATGQPFGRAAKRGTVRNRPRKRGGTERE